MTRADEIINSEGIAAINSRNGTGIVVRKCGSCDEFHIYIIKPDTQSMPVATFDGEERAICFMLALDLLMSGQNTEINKRKMH